MSGSLASLHRGRRPTMCHVRAGRTSRGRAGVVSVSSLVSPLSLARRSCAGAPVLRMVQRSCLPWWRLRPVLRTSDWKEVPTFQPTSDRRHGFGGGVHSPRERAKRRNGSSNVKAAKHERIERQGPLIKKKACFTVDYYFLDPSNE